MESKLFSARQTRAMRCAWFSTGDTSRPLRCVWVPVEVSNRVAAAPSDETGGIGLCA
jgi:hypothetical protein